MTIHSTDPFATPEEQRLPLRRLRGRLAAPVTLWTADGPAGPAGLTVSSVLVADGEPGRILGLVDDESQLWEAVREVRRFAVCVLGPGDRRLADQFAGLLPAPGGPFRGYEWIQTPYGPVPAAPAEQTGGARPATPPPADVAPPVAPAGFAYPARPVGGRTWIGCILSAVRPYGWALLIEAVVERVTLGTPGDPLVHFRGRYREFG